MAKTTKFVFLGLSLLLLTVMMVTYFLPGMVIPSQYKADITALLNRKMGLNVIFEGDVSVSFNLPWAEITVVKLVIPNPAAFGETPFCTLDTGFVSLNLRSLMTNKLEIGRAFFSGLTVNLSKNKQGKKNWDELLTAVSAKSSDMKVAKTEADVVNDVAAYSIANLHIQHANLHWSNQQTDQDLWLKNIQFSADKLAVGEHINVDVALDILRGGHAFPTAVSGRAGLVIDNALNHIELSHLEMESEWSEKIFKDQPLTVTAMAAQAEVTLSEETFQLTGLTVRSGEVAINAKISGSGLTEFTRAQGTVNLESLNPRKVMERFDITFPAMQGSKTLSQLSLSCQFQANADRAHLTNLAVNLDESHGKGSLAINDYNSLNLAFALAVDYVNADQYLLSPAYPAKGRLKAKAAGKFDPTGITVPLKALSKLRMEGNLKMKEVIFNQMTLHQMDLTLLSEKGKLTVTQ